MIMMEKLYVVIGKIIDFMFKGRVKLIQLFMR